MIRIIQNAFNTMLVLSYLLLIQSCKENPELPDNLAEFQANELGIASDESEIEVTISFSREITSDENLVVHYESDEIEYGTDFTTEPASVANSITVPLESGMTSASLKVKKVTGVFYDGDEELVLTLSSVPDFLVLGDQVQLTVTFAEIVAGSGEMEVNGGGILYPNKVFIDLSANRQTAIERITWDLGFSSGDEFNVILNSSNGMMARILDKNDLNAVTAADTVGFGNQLSLAAVFSALLANPIPVWVAEAITWIDDPTGNLSNTAIGAVSATASENKAYIINRGSGPGSSSSDLGWKKIRVTRNGNGYTLQHADIGAAGFSEIQITKSSDHAFEYVNLYSGSVVVEPASTRWDIAWTGFTNSTNFGSGPVPYYFQDIILQNMTGVQTAQVLTTTITYEAFSETDLASVSFADQSQIRIGSSWRTSTPGVPPTIRTDRFYIVKDADDNYYKLRFVSLTTNGERGKPRFEFELVKVGI